MGCPDTTGELMVSPDVLRASCYGAAKAPYSIGVRMWPASELRPRTQSGMSCAGCTRDVSACREARCSLSGAVQGRHASRGCMLDMPCRQTGAAAACSAMRHESRASAARSQRHTRCRKRPWMAPSRRAMNGPCASCGQDGSVSHAESLPSGHGGLLVNPPLRGSCARRLALVGGVLTP